MGSTLTYDLYVDDSGSREPDRRHPQMREDGVDAFALGGVLVPAERTTEIVRAVQELVASLRIDYPLHSAEIRCRRGNFCWVEQDVPRTKTLYDGIDEIVSALPGWITATVIHRPGYNDRYRDVYGDRRWHLCQTAYQILLERAAKIARADGRRLKVFVEETGKKEDRRIRHYHQTLLDCGMGFDKANSAKYGPMNSAAFSEILIRNPKFIKKKNEMAQVADLVLYPLVKVKDIKTNHITC